MVRVRLRVCARAKGLSEASNLLKIDKVLGAVGTAGARRLSGGGFRNALFASISLTGSVVHFVSRIIIK